MVFNVEISGKDEQPLTLRTVMTGFVSYDQAPPSFAELKKHIASSLKLDELLVVIQKLHPVFGARKSSLEAHIYKNKAALDSFASKVIITRNSPRVKKAAAQPASK